MRRFAYPHCFSGMVVALLCVMTVPANASDIIGAAVFPGEHATYAVQFMTMDIARVHFETLEPVDSLGVRLYHVRARIQSTSQLPMFYAEDVYESYLDASGRPLIYRGQGKRKEYTFRVEMRFDYQAGVVEAREYRSRGREERLAWECKKPLQDDMYDHLSLFYIVRAYLQKTITQKPLVAHIVADGKIKSIRFSPRSRVEKAVLIDRQVRSIPLKMELGFSTLAGLRAIDFLLTADEKSIPVGGEVRFLLGQATIRLIDYTPGRLPYVQAAESSAGGGTAR